MGAPRAPSHSTVSLPGVFAATGVPRKECDQTKRSSEVAWTGTKARQLTRKFMSGAG